MNDQTKVNVRFDVQDHTDKGSTITFKNGYNSKIEIHQTDIKFVDESYPF